MFTTFEYQEAIQHFSNARKRILTSLYEIEPVVDSCLIADKLSYKDYRATNLQIGSIGKTISEYYQRTPDIIYNYKGKEKCGYYSQVHNHNGENWAMVKDLKQAIKQLGCV